MARTSGIQGKCRLVEEWRWTTSTEERCIRRHREERKCVARAHSIQTYSFLLIVGNAHGTMLYPCSSSLYISSLCLLKGNEDHSRNVVVGLNNKYQVQINRERMKKCYETWASQKEVCSHTFTLVNVQGGSQGSNSMSGEAEAVLLID